MSAEVGARGASRWSMAVAYTRLEAIEDLSYPMSIALDEGKAVLPVLVQYFVAQLVPPGRASVGGDYFTFAIVGLSVAAMLQAALSGFGRRLQRAQDQGTFETLLVEPVPWSFVPFAMNIWRMLLGCVSGAVMLLTAALLGADFDLSGVPAFIGVVGLGVTATASIGILSTSLMILAKRSTPVVNLYGLAATLLGGALFPLDLFPSWLRAIAYLLPHTHAISSARAALMQQPPETLVTSGESLLVLAAFTLVVGTLGAMLFSRSLQYARKMGMLSGY